MKTAVAGFFLVSVGLACAGPPVTAPQARSAAPASPAGVEHLTVFISDLHFGPPNAADRNKYGPLDDFRWPAALRAFLDQISRMGNGTTDLVILGDLFELWQHPATPCRDRGADFGCTEGEMAAVVAPVLAKHHGELVDLWSFAETRNNRLFIVPGNHDATLLSDKIWRQLTDSIGHPGARVTRSLDGAWASADGTIMAEHGHQIGPDVSGFQDWPSILIQASDGKRFRRPWGELFVQQFFDGVESTMPIIDNIIPQSFGVSLLLKKSGFTHDAKDVAKFFAFNIFHTSIGQLATLNYDERTADEAALDPTHGWSIPKARELKERLFADSLPADDPFRNAVLDTTNPAWDPFRAELRSIVADPVQLPDDAVVELCDRIASLSKAEPAVPRASCSNVRIFSTAAGLIPDAILARHLEKLYDKDHDILTFVFGHTHQASPPTPIKLRSNRQVTVVNDGAFQRLTSPEVLTRIAGEPSHRGLSEALSLSPEDLPPCYSAVLIRTGGPERKIELKNWKMREDESSGAWVDICDSACGRIAAKCKNSP
jgi:UDP-2,3-diacylglucosamine pyrophosphatase LpxH